MVYGEEQGQHNRQDREDQDGDTHKVDFLLIIRILVQIFAPYIICNIGGSAQQIGIAVVTMNATQATSTTAPSTNGR